MHGTGGSGGCHTVARLPTMRAPWAEGVPAVRSGSIGLCVPYSAVSCGGGQFVAYVERRMASPRFCGDRQRL